MATTTAVGTHLLDTLKARGFVAQISDEPELRQRLDAGSCTLYQGFDPTASSLHIGNLVGTVGRTRDGWNEKIDDMVLYGLKVTPQERALILDYLATYLPRE